MAVIATAGDNGFVRPRAADAGFTPIWLLPIPLVLSEFTSIPMFGIGLTPMHAFLMALFVPALIRLTQTRLGLGDWLMIAFLLWASAMRVRNIGPFVAVSYFLDAGVMFLVVRAFTRSAQDILILLRIYFVLILALGVLAAIESITANHFIADFIRRFDPSFNRLRGLEFRAGLARAGVLTHPILYGAFCASIFALVWYTQKSAATSVLKCLLIFAAMFFSLSSGPLVATAMQIGLIATEYYSRGIKKRALLITSAVVAAFAVIQVVASHGVFGVVAHYLTFNSASAWYRQMIWTQVTGDIARNPIFGMNPVNWTKKPGMSDSIDAQWLLVTLGGGLPAIILLTAALLAMIRGLFHRTDAEVGPELAALRRGWTFCMLALAFAGLTVSYFSIMQHQWHLMMGLGGALVQLVRAHSAAAPSAAVPATSQRLSWAAAPSGRALATGRPVVGDLRRQAVRAATGGL